MSAKGLETVDSVSSPGDELSQDLSNRCDQRFSFPGQAKLLTLKLIGVELTGTVAWNLHSKTCIAKYSCKDRILRGKLFFNLRDRAIEYRKRLPLPVWGSRLGCLVLSGYWALNDLDHSWSHSFRAGFEFRRGCAELVQLNSLRLKPRLFYNNLGIVAKTNVTLQLPTKLLFELPQTARDASNRPDDEDALGLNLEVQQLDVVLRL